MTRELRHLLGKRALQMEPKCRCKKGNISKHLDEHLPILQRFGLVELVAMAKFPPAR